MYHKKNRKKFISILATALFVCVCGVPSVSMANLLSFAGETIADQTWTQGVAVSITLPVAQEVNLEGARAEQAITYTLTPSLPNGVSFDATTRQITGTPSGTAPIAAYTYTATKTGFTSASLTFKITVTAAKGVTVSPTSLAIDEGSTGTFTLVLTAAPTADVTLTPSSNNTDITLDAASYTFATTGWDTAQTVTVSAAQDADSTDDTGTITFSVTSTDADYSGMTVSSVDVTVDDDEGTLSFGNTTIADQTWTQYTPSSPRTLPTATASEGSPTITYTLTPSLPSGLSFNAANRQIIGTPSGTAPRTAYTYTAAATGYTSATLTFNITVNAPVVSKGVTVSPTSLTIAEGSTGTFTLVLTAVPTADVTLTPSSSNGDITLDAASYTFTTTGWDTTQTVTVAAAQDADTADDTATITFSVTSTDTGYSGIAVSAVGVTVTDAGTPPPAKTVSFGNTTIADQTWTQHTQISPLTLPAATASEGSPTIGYTLSPSLPSGLSFDATSRTISGTPTVPVTNAAYTYTATATDYTPATLTFTVTVTGASITPPPPAAKTLAFNTTIADQTWTQDLAISLLTLPTATASEGSPSITYTLTPSLPSGVSFDATTRQITGTPTVPVTRAAYTYTATATDYTPATLTFNIVVNAPVTLTVPGAPTHLTATPNTDKTVTVSWAAPVNTGGSAITGYVLTQTGQASATYDLTGTDTVYTTATLADGAYTFTVRATNSIGTGPASTPVSIHLTTDVPPPSTAAADSQPADTSVVAMNRIVFNELYNGTDATADWLELRNISTTDIDLADWEISIVARDGPHADTDVDIVDFPAWTLPAGGLLLIVNTDPSETDLLRGIAITESTAEKGRRHRYLVAEDCVLPNSPYLLILRSATDKNGEPEAFEDVAGNYFYQIWQETQIWPLKGAQRPTDPAPLTLEKAWRRVMPIDTSTPGWTPVARGWAAAAWTESGYQHGVGYTPKTASETVKTGTPGYPNDAVTGGIATTGQVSFSELMFTAHGEPDALPQWIELFNNSETAVVALNGWRLAIEARAADGAYRSGSVQLKDVTILPRQTVLIVTGNARNSGHFPEGRVYDLSVFGAYSADFEQDADPHTVLGLSGFYLKLSDARGTISDIVGNLDGNRRTSDAPKWELPAMTTAAGARMSLIRRYDPDTRIPLDGTLLESWQRAADLSLAVRTYWGRDTDIGNPGYRMGGILPVGLSRFRSARSAAGLVVITWTTASETNNAGFNLLRSETLDGRFVQVNPTLIPGAGTTSDSQTYTYQDTAAKPNVAYFYRLEDVSFSGERHRLATVQLRGPLAAAGKLATRWGALKTQD